MLLCEITSSKLTFHVTYYVDGQPHTRYVSATSKKSAIKKVSKYGRVHKIRELPTSYGRAVDSKSW